MTFILAICTWVHLTIVSMYNYCLLVFCNFQSTNDIKKGQVKHNHAVSSETFAHSNFFIIAKKAYQGLHLSVKTLTHSFSTLLILYRVTGGLKPLPRDSGHQTSSLDGVPTCSSHYHAHTLGNLKTPISRGG